MIEEYAGSTTYLLRSYITVNFNYCLPLLGTISELVNEYQNALSDAATKNKVDIAVKNALRKQLEYQNTKRKIFIKSFFYSQTDSLLQALPQTRPRPLIYQNKNPSYLPAYRTGG
ncbi:MAG: hypothetical protein ACTHM5_08885 [Ginsengibacter sp.]